MGRLRRLTVLAALGSFVCVSSLWAQSSQFSRGTTSSSSANRFSSSSATRSTSSGTRATGSSSSRFGTPASSQTSQASTVQSSLDSRINQLMPNDNSLRSARGSQDFVGADRGDVPNLTGFSDPSQGQGSSGRTTLSNRSSLRQPTANRSNRQRGLSGMATSGRRRSGMAATEVQPVLRLGFDSAAASPNPAADLASMLSHRSRALAGTQVELNGGVAILTGTAESEHARALAEQLLSLEPGVRRVENRLTVVSPASAAGGLAQP